MTSVDTTTNDVATQTIREFFESTETGTFVMTAPSRRSSWFALSTPFIFMGWKYNDDRSNLIPALINPAFMSEHSLSEDLLTETDHTWQVVKENDENKVASPELIQALSTLESVRKDNREWSKTCDDMQNEINKKVSELHSVRSDFEKVNLKLNEFAVDKGYCPDYEYHIGLWNQELSVMKLIGRRPRNWNISVYNNDNYLGCIIVEAHSQEEANELLAGMSSNEKIRNMLENDCYFEDLSMSFGDPSAD